MNDSALISSAPEGGDNFSAMEMVMPRHVAAVVPFAQHEAYGRLSPDQKARVSYLLQLFAEMATAPDGVVACADRLEALNPGKGFSAVNLLRLYYKFRKAEKRQRGTGWPLLAKIYKGPAKLPAEFVQEVRRRMEKNARSARAAMQDLKDAWARGEEIPGYGSWRHYFFARWPDREMPERYPIGFFPEGWSESNLYTKQTSRAERALVKQGYAAMKRYIPSVVRDTSKLRPLELITIDDFELDFLVRAFNPVSKRWETCTAAGLLAIDVATRRKLAIALVPRFKLSRSETSTGVADAEGSDEKKRRIAITRQDVQSLLHVVFSTHGRPADYGCTILCENASAAITGDFELALELLLGVQVARTGLIAEKTLRNGFVQGGGKPWEKGWIESLFNKVWNAAGAMPGYKGSDYTKKPADHEAKVAYAEKLFKLDGLTPEIVAKLRFSFLTIDEALDGLNAIFARIEQRTDHAMLGFDQLFDYQLPDTAGLITEAEIHVLPREVVLQATPVPRRESPLERWEKLMPTVQRVAIAEYVLACLLLVPKRIKLLNHKLTCVHAGTGYTFTDADSPVMQLPEGTEVLGYFDAGRPHTMHVTDLKGRYIGAVKRRGAIDIRDHAAISAEAGEITRLIRSCVINPVRERHAVDNAQLASDDAHNQAVQRAAGIEAPITMQPAKTNLPDGRTAATAAPSGHSIGAQAPTQNQSEVSSTRPASLSKLIAAPQRLARDAFAPGAALAAAVSAAEGEREATATRRAATHAAASALSPEDMAAFTERPAPAPQPADDQTMEDYS